MASILNRFANLPLENEKMKKSKSEKAQKIERRGLSFFSYISTSNHKILESLSKLDETRLAELSVTGVAAEEGEGRAEVVGQGVGDGGGGRSAGVVEEPLDNVQIDRGGGVAGQMERGPPLLVPGQRGGARSQQPLHDQI